VTASRGPPFNEESSDGYLNKFVEQYDVETAVSAQTALKYMTHG
jgi:hypothetical protein